MTDQFIIKNGKKLRCGYTTGSCATAVAKASTMMLFKNMILKNVDINTPKGVKLKINIEDVRVEKNQVTCSVTKDSGDDPDITNGIKIYATARKIEKGINIKGGKGIGVVTKKGLSVSVGKPAINPVPMKMILSHVKEVLPTSNGVEIEIMIPNGEEIAKKTFNPKLGIVGGLSIIGTSGIVEPMSEDAQKESLALEISMLKAEGVESIVFVPGNYGRDFALKLGIKDKYIVKTSNYIGYMLDYATRQNIKRILIIGHLGKMSKVAGGIFQTHSKYADCRMEVIASYCGSLYDCSSKLIKEILECITTDEVVDIIKQENKQQVFNVIAERVSIRASERALEEVEVQAIIFTNQYGVIGKSKLADDYLEEFLNE
ncbi:cobalt-precorrin-5B (C(1))-methyltransferase CbiD [Clostridiaceae bacterium M8S5]|nr:cobalt-precorrin-5B (C(1))-methyltransferase CbiD [Clostridiaceae bacterium M8S5]